MKQYGFQMSTEFTKKQISCLYRAAKNGDLKIEKWIMADLYDMADYYGYDSNRSVTEAETYVLKMLEYFFAGDLERTQREIDRYTERTFPLLGRKAQEKACRDFV